MNADGTGQTRLTTDPAGGRYPAWSPDGNKILYTREFQLWVMNANGSGQSLLYQDCCEDLDEAAWSPDGQKIVASVQYGGLKVINADGTDPTTIVPFTGNEVSDPEWAPNGQKIAFHDDDTNLLTVNPDGTGMTSIRSNYPNAWAVQPDWAPDSSKIVYSGSPGIATVDPDWTSLSFLTQNGDRPVWSPDKAKIAFDDFVSATDREIRSMDADGSNQVNLTNNPAIDIEPDWQPLTPPGYARPKNASPTTFRLVPSYKECTSANAEHGAPLVEDSCSPAEPTSSFLTVGTSDANGKASSSVGYLTMKVLTESPIDLTNGDQSDVEFTAQVTDVRDKQTLADYTGELRAVFTLRITDRYNGPGGVHPATVENTLFGFNISCTPTPEPPDVGSTCSTSTTADAILPGITPEKKRAIWQLGRIVIQDGGSDGDADTPGNTVFARQGLFAP